MRMTGKPSSVLEVRRNNGATVVVLQGEIDLHHVPEVQKVLVAEWSSKPTMLIIDLGDVGYMDSSGVGMLVQAFQKMKAADGKLRLVRMRDRVRSVFEITRLDKYFTICESEDEALTT